MLSYFRLLVDSRSKARDAQRLSDLAQLQFALELYFEEHGEFPKESTVGTHNGRIGIGGPMDVLLADYLNTIPTDPLSDTDNEVYFYYFDSWHQCTTDVQPINAVLYANTMEGTHNANRDDLCPDYDDSEPNFCSTKFSGLECTLFDYE